MAVQVPLHCPPFANPSTYPFSRFNTLQTYLEDDDATADARTAAITITATINGPVSATCPTLEGDTASGVSNLWATVLGIAAQVPYDHPWQDKLVALVAAIKALPAPAHLDMDAWLQKGYGPMWGGLGIFGRTVYEVWSEKGLFCDRVTSDEVERAFARDEWVNFNAFLARVSAGRVKELESYGTEILKGVLEGGDHSASMVNDNLPAAAVWVLYAGDMIYESLTSSEGSGLSRDKRWALWKEALGELMRDEVLHHNTRDWAIGALQAMAHINIVTEPATH